MVDEESSSRGGWALMDYEAEAVGRDTPRPLSHQRYTRVRPLTQTALPGPPHYIRLLNFITLDKAQMKMENWDEQISYR